MRTVYLDYRKAQELGIIVNLKEYYEKYDNDTRSQYKLLAGAPLVINVEGTYVLLEKIPLLLQNTPSFVYNNIRSTKYAIDDDSDVVRYRWLNRYKLEYDASNREKKNDD